MDKIIGITGVGSGGVLHALSEKGRIFAYDGSWRELPCPLASEEAESMFAANPPAPSTDPLPGHSDFQSFRWSHPRLWIARTGEDGDLNAWRALHREYGPDILHKCYIAHERSGDKKPLFYSAALGWLQKHVVAS